MVYTKSNCSSRKRGGSALIEFALAFTLLWTFLSAIFQFGYGMYCYNALTIAVDNATAYASTVDFDSSAQTFVSKIQNTVVFGNPSGGLTPLVPGLTKAQVAVTWSIDSAGAPQTITITIQGYTCNAIFASWTWNGKPFATSRFMGVWKS